MIRRMGRALWLAALSVQLIAQLTILDVEAQQTSRPQTRLLYRRERGAEACPDQAQLRDAVSGRLGYVPFDDAATMQVQVEIRRTGRKLSAEVSVDPGDGSGARTRALSSAARNCDELADGLALAVSIAIDPLSLTRPAEAAPAPTPEPAPAPQPEPEPAPVAVVAEPVRAENEPAPKAPKTETGVAFRAGGDGLVSLGAVPNLTGGLTVHAGVVGTRWSAALELRADLPRAKQSGEEEVEALRSIVQLVPCFEARWFFGCGVGSAGLLSAKGQGRGPSARDNAFIAGAGARIGGKTALTSHLYLRAYLEGVAALTKTALLRSDQEIWRTPTWSGSLAIGLFGEWP